jgi:hypothetical protein
VFTHLPRLSMHPLLSFTSHISVRMAANRPHPELPLRPQQIPTRLYRVHYLSSMTTRDTSGLRAQDGSTNSADHSSVVEHLNWSSDVPSPWISLFDTEEHAVRWAQYHQIARRIMGLREERFYVLEIDRRELGIVVSVARLSEYGVGERRKPE